MRMTDPEDDDLPAEAGPQIHPEDHPGHWNDHGRDTETWLEEFDPPGQTGQAGQTWTTGNLA